MDKHIREEMVAAAREVGRSYGKTAELDFGAGAEWMYKKLTYKEVGTITKTANKG